MLTPLCRRLACAGHRLLRAPLQNIRRDHWHCSWKLFGQICPRYKGRSYAQHCSWIGFKSLSVCYNMLVTKLCSTDFQWSKSGVQHRADGQEVSRFSSSRLYLDSFMLLTFVILFRGSQYVELPYTVKGMDVSFSGILSYIEVSASVRLLDRARSNLKSHNRSIWLCE